MIEKKMSSRIVTIKDLWQIFVYRFWILILVSTLCVSGLFVFNMLTFQPRYSSTATMYILRQTNENMSSNDISSEFSVALKVVNDCNFLLKSDTVVNSVKESLALGEEYDNLRDYITTKNPTDTRILQITVEADSPAMAKKIVDALCEVGAKSINQAMGFDQVNLFEYGNIDTTPCNKTSLLIYLMIGAAVAAVTFLIFVIMFIMDDTLRSDEDCQLYLGVTILGDIPDAEDTHKKKYGGYYRGYYRRYGYGYRADKSSPQNAKAEGTEEKK